MAWWISGGVVVLALVFLIVVAVIVLGSLRRFGVVSQSLQRRLLDGQKRLEPGLATLQERGDALQGPLLVASQRMEVLAAKRGESAEQ